MSRIYPLLLVFLLVSTIATAQPDITLAARITTGLSSPIQFVSVPDPSGRKFIVEQGGAIKAYSNTFTFLSVFLQVEDVQFNNEQGLMSMAFHPNYSTNGFFYVFYVNGDDDLVLDRYSVSDGDANLADVNSRVNLITIPHRDNENHNGGELHFGTDGYLYLSTGDGGGTGDVPNNAQSTTVLLGKILRFNVNTSATAPYYTIPPGNPFGNEIYDRGLRNPFRWSFDRQTGDMWIGDVGQGTSEEINFRPAAAAPGVNYGWRCYEGTNVYNGAGCGPASNYLPPVHTYPTQSPAAVTGGVVYRGSSPALNGYYISADFFSGTYYFTIPDGLGGWTTTTQTVTPNRTGIADFGEDAQGEVYVVSLTGNAVYQVAVVDDTPLPLTLLNFEAKPYNGTSVKLDWQTTMEANLVAFEIGRSDDGTTFTTIGSKQATNEPNGASYSYIDEDLATGQHYYRLKILENDGSYSFSQVVRIDRNGRTANWIYPSLVARNSSFIVNTPDASFNSIELYSANGVLVYQKNIRGMTGNIKVNTGNQPAGLYIVHLVGDTNRLSGRVVIQ